jgi:hypothetical protein
MLNKQRVDHILRAAGVVTGKTKFVLIGSAAVAAWRSDLPEIMMISRDVDLFAYDAPDAAEVADLLDGALGQASQFDAEFGYYCDGVEPETAVLPGNWRDRAKLYSNPATNGVEALAPEPNDIALSKVVAWRPKDVAWLRAAVSAGIVEVETMIGRLAYMPARAGDIADLKTRLDSLRLEPGNP